MLTNVQTELMHEKEGLKNGAEFIATSVTAAAGSAKEVLNWQLIAARGASSGACLVAIISI